MIETFSDSNYAGDKRDRKSISGYYTYVGGNLVIWSKKQTIVSHSSTEIEYKAMARTCELMWLKTLLGKLGFSEDGPISIYCDNQAAIYIANNPFFHERTKHIGCIATLFVMQLLRS